MPEEKAQDPKGPGAPKKMNELVYAEICAFRDSWVGTNKEMGKEIQKKWNVGWKTFRAFEKEMTENKAGK